MMKVIVCHRMNLVDIMNYDDEFPVRSTILDSWEDKLVVVIFTDSEKIGIAILKSHDDHGILFDTKSIEKACYDPRMSSGMYKWSRIYCIDLFTPKDDDDTKMLFEITGSKTQVDNIAEATTVILPNSE